MNEFSFLQDSVSKKWISFSPRRAKRPDVANSVPEICPFCPGNEKEQPAVYVIASEAKQSPPGHSELDSESEIASSSASWPTSRNDEADWLIRVIPNKFPFAPIHEIVIHSPDHHKNFGELPLSQVELILQTYRQRYNEHKDNGQVYIFHNRGEGAGESLPHPHTQLVVVPHEVTLQIPPLNRHSGLSRIISSSSNQDSGEVVLPAGRQVASQNDSELASYDAIETQLFRIFCPKVSQWPDEVWIASLGENDRTFGEISDDEITDLADIMTRLVQIYDHRYGHEFPFNFYIYPGKNWYLRLIPRVKSLGGFEIGTGVFVNTQNPKETAEFIKEHYQNPDFEKIRTQHQAVYGKKV